jgi:hypothetical protein
LAIQRSIIRSIGGFFDKAILGSGDSILYIAIKNKNIQAYKWVMSSILILIQEINKYKDSIAKSNLQITCLNCNIYHLFHGTKINRKYGTRYSSINHLSWNEIFELNSDGFWEFKDPAKMQITDLYFKSRQEDSKP